MIPRYLNYSQYFILIQKCVQAHFWTVIFLHVIFFYFPFSFLFLFLFFSFSFSFPSRALSLSLSLTFFVSNQDRIRTKSDFKEFSTSREGFKVRLLKEPLLDFKFFGFKTYFWFKTDFDDFQVKLEQKLEILGSLDLFQDLEPRSSGCPLRFCDLGLNLQDFGLISAIFRELEMSTGRPHRSTGLR